MKDEDVMYVMKWCKQLGITVHIRGTDERPVCEFRDKRTRRTIGGSEVKRRIRAYEKRPQTV